MAAGITEPVATILAEDSTHADAGGDGFFDELDFLAKFPARFVDLGTVPTKTFRVLDSMQSGDGAGSAPTNLRFRDCSIKFDNLKTFTVSTLGVSGRTTTLGEKVGTDGVQKGANLEFTGAGTTVRGVLNMYDSRIYNVNQGVSIRPPFDGAGELLQSTIETAGTIGFLGESTIAMGRIRNLTLIHRPTAANTVINVPDCQGLVLIAKAGALYALRPTGVMSVRGLTVRAAGQSIADLFPVVSSVDWDLTDPTWSQIVPPMTAIQGTGFNVWEGYTANFWTVDPRNGAKVAGVALEILDRFGVSLVDVDTDAEGLVTYGAAARANALRYRRWFNPGVGLSIEDQFPWTVRVNHKRAIKTNFLPLEFEITPAGRNFTGGRQFYPISLEIPLVPLGGSIEEWRPGIA